MYFIYFNWRLITLQHCGSFCHTSTCIGCGYTSAPHPQCPPSPLPAHPIPRRCPRARALSALLHASDLRGSPISHSTIHVFQCCPLRTSRPRLLPQSPKVCRASLHLLHRLARGADADVRALDDAAAATSDLSVLLAEAALFPVLREVGSLSPKRERDAAIGRDTDGRSSCHTRWRRSDRGQTSIAASRKVAQTTSSVGQK